MSYDDPMFESAFGPLIVGLALALVIAVIIMTGGEGSMPEPLTTLPDTVYPAKEESDG